MGRRVSNGTVGAGPTFGSLVATTNTLSTAGSNTPLIIDPAGTGTTQFVGNIQLNGNGVTGGELRLGDADVSTSSTQYYISLRAPAVVSTSNKTFTFPDSLGTAGYVLQTDGSGVLSWASQTTAGITIADNSSNAALRILFNPNVTTGQVTSFSSNSGLTYNPTGGILSTTVGEIPTIRGGSTASQTLTVLSTSNGTKASAGILMTENIQSTSTTTGTLVIGNTSDALTSGGLGVRGQVTCFSLSSASITETSSITLKENLNPITNALDLILQLQSYIYDRKDGSIKNEAGLIAEQVYEIIPNLVKLNADGKPESIMYTKLTTYLLEAIKTLKQEINELKGQR